MKELPLQTFEQMEQFVKVLIQWTFYTICLTIAVLFLHFACSAPTAGEWVSLIVVTLSCLVCYFGDTKWGKRNTANENLL